MRIKWWHIALVICIAVVFLSPLASSSPDGLEKVAEDHEFIEQAHEAPFQIIADYLFPGIENEALATVLAGIIGTLIIFGTVYGLARLLRLRKRQEEHPSTE
jgi:cobalt/nickel transport protein